MQAERQPERRIGANKRQDQRQTSANNTLHRTNQGGCTLFEDALAATAGTQAQRLGAAGPGGLGGGAAGLPDDARASSWA